VARTRPDLTAIQVVAVAALGGEIVVESVEDGVSTYVYRLGRGADVFYLRVLPEEGASFSPEVAVHAILRRQGARVPEVVYWEDLNHVVERPVMITTEIGGRAIGRGTVRSALPGILRAAGRDLALMNRVPVDGFGWIKRDVAGDEGLQAAVPTEREFMLADLSHSLAVLDGVVLGGDQIGMIQDAARDYATLLDAPSASLAHGDLDATHIYCQRGCYTGIIDFGEIRGTGPYYDLGHFRFHDGETLTLELFPFLVEGYREVTHFSSDADRQTAFNSVLIGVEFLARTHARLAKHSRLHSIAAIERDLRFLTT
jgi:Phosphotransferase enzyme family